MGIHTKKPLMFLLSAFSWVTRLFGCVFVINFDMIDMGFGYNLCFSLVMSYSTPRFFLEIQEKDKVLMVLHIIFELIKCILLVVQSSMAMDFQ